MRSSRRLLVLLGAALLVLLGSRPAPAAAQSQQITDYLAQLDSEFRSGIGPVILDGQIRYYTFRGQFFQGGITHSRIPTNGERLPPDRLLDTLSDVPGNWYDVVESWGDLPFAMRIDTYESPRGAGFVVWLAVRLDGDVYVKKLGYGTDRGVYSRDWAVWDPDPGA